MADLTPEALRIYDLLKDAMPSTSVSEDSAPRWDQDDVYPPLAELRRAQMTDVEWTAMSEWDKDLWEMKHLPEKDRMNSIEGIVMWLPVAQREQRRKELLEEVLRFGEPAPTLVSSATPAPSTPDVLVGDATPTTAFAISTTTSVAASASTTTCISSPATPATTTTTGGGVSESCCLEPEPVAAIATHEIDLCSVTPTNCSMICLGGDTSVAATPSYQSVVPASSASTLVSSTTVSAAFISPAVGDLLEGDDKPTLTPPSSCLVQCPSGGICTLSCHDGATDSVVSNNTDGMLPLLGIFRVTHDLLIESHSGCSDIVPVPQVPDRIIVIASGPYDHTPQADQGLLNTVMMLENIKPVLSLELPLLVLFVMKKEVMLWPVFQSAIGNTVLLLPWDPGVLLNGMCTHFQGFLPTCCFYQGTRLNCKFGHYLQVYIVLYLNRDAQDDLLEGGDILTSLLPTYVAVMNHFATNDVMTTFILSGRRFSELKQFGVRTLQTGIKRPPWPPPWSIGIQNIIQLGVHDMSFMSKTTLPPLLVESVEYIGNRIEIRLCCFSSQDAELFLFRYVACRIPNQHGTMYTKQISGDRPFSTTLELEWNATLTVSISGLGVQCAQLQPTVSKWKDLSCAINTKCCNFANVHFQWSITVQQSTSSSGFFVILNGKTEVQRHYLVTFVEYMHITGIYWELNQFMEAASHGSKSYGCLDFEGKMMGGQIVTESATRLGPHIAEWKIPWLQNGGLIMHFTVNSMGLQPTEVLNCSLLIQWSCVLMSVRASFYATLLNATQVLGAYTSSQNWQNGTKLQNTSCWNGSSLLMHIPVCFIEPLFLPSVLLDHMNDINHRYYHDPAYPPSQAIQFPWDPGECSASVWRQGNPGRMNDECPCSIIDKSQVPWDPGGSSPVRLGGKPNFMEGMSTTCLHGLASGPPPRSLACFGARRRADWEAYKQQNIHS